MPQERAEIEENYRAYVQEKARALLTVELLKDAEKLINADLSTAVEIGDARTARQNIQSLKDIHTLRRWLK